MEERRRGSDRGRLGLRRRRRRRVSFSDGSTDEEAGLAGEIVGEGIRDGGRIDGIA